MLSIFTKKTDLEKMVNYLDKGYPDKAEQIINNSSNPEQYRDIAFKKAIESHLYVFATTQIDLIEKFETNEEDPHQIIRLAAKAAEHGQEYLAAKMVDKLDNLDQLDNLNRNALSSAIILNLDDTILESIQAKTTNFDTEDSVGKTPLSIAIEEGKAELALAIIEKTSNVDSSDIHGYTALMGAIQKKQETIAFKILEKMDNIDQKNDFGQDALTLASICSSAELLEAVKKKVTPAITVQIQEALTPIFKGISSRPEDTKNASKYLRAIADRIDSNASKKAAATQLKS